MMQTVLHKMDGYTDLITIMNVFQVINQLVGMYVQFVGMMINL